MHYLFPSTLIDILQIFRAVCLQIIIQNKIPRIKYKSICEYRIPIFENLYRCQFVNVKCV